MNEIQLTKEELLALQEELDHLKTVGRKETAEKIATARGFGDLSENAEYDEAMADQGKMEARIQELEAMIRNAVILDESSFEADKVNRSSTVVLKNIEAKTEHTYKIVGPTQTNPLEGKISDESPVGKAIMGHKIGDVVEVEAPKGKLKFEIIEIK